MIKSPLRGQPWTALLLALTLAAQAAPKQTAKPAPIKGPEILGFWHLERDVKSDSRSGVFGAATRLDQAEFYFTEEVPGQFIYDPIQKLSFPNNFSLNFQSAEGHNDALEIPITAAKAKYDGQSMTLEMFFKPDETWDSPIVMKSRLTEAASDWGLEARFFEQFNQTYLHAFFTAPGATTEHFRGGHFGTSAQIHPDNLAWRHMAIVLNAEAKTLSCYIDYYQVKTIPLVGEIKWDEAPFYIGGGPLKSGFKGRVDEVRLTRGALPPTLMLRARQEPLANVNFTSVETVLPRESGYIDIKEAFGAIGDGRTNDTAAFSEAFRQLSDRRPVAHHTLYVPPGVYLVDQTLESGQRFTVQGAGAGKTIIRLRDKAPGFESGEKRPVWRTNPATATAPAPFGDPSNDASQISIYDLSIDTGKGNPGAIGLEYHSNNLGRLEKIHIYSTGGEGAIGLDLTRKANGPALIKNVEVSGFDYGIATSHQEYSMTFEGLKLAGQRIAGLRNSGNILALRKLHSVNKVPAIVSEGENSMITLLDSTLVGEAAVKTRRGGTPSPSAKNTAAIQSDGALYLLRVEASGYREAVRKRLPLDEESRQWKTDVVVGPRVAEYIGDKTLTGHGRPLGALKLAIEDTPEVPWGDIHKDWVNVQRFAGQKAGEDWAPAIQAAIDSGARTIYFPYGRYEVAKAVHLHGKVERLFGLHSRIVQARGVAPEEPVIIFDEPDGTRVVSIERLDIGQLQHASPATLVLKSSTPHRYTNTEGAGKLFLEDVGGITFQFGFPQHVWARQWSPESESEGPCISSRGAAIWCLGFKAESSSSKLWAEAGAETEILGALIVPEGDIPIDRPIFKNTDSRMSLIYGTSKLQTDFPLHILDTKGDDALRIESHQLRHTGNRARMDLFTSDGLVPARETN